MATTHPWKENEKQNVKWNTVDEREPDKETDDKK